MIKHANNLFLVRAKLIVRLRRFERCNEPALFLNLSKRKIVCSVVDRLIVENEGSTIYSLPINDVPVRILLPYRNGLV